MNRISFICFLFIAYAVNIGAREGHNGESGSFIHWIGNFHPVLLHFPIALITMTGIAELLFSYSSRPIFDNAARFMILVAALVAIPTALCGLAWSYGSDYGLYENLLDWHRIFGLSTTLLAIITAYMREYKGRSAAYAISLVFAVIFVTVTGFMGGSLTFGINSLFPPI